MQTSTARRFLTVRQMADEQPGLSIGSIRWDLFNREKNGLVAAGAVVRRGRKVILDSEKYLDWVATGQET